jgi:hypothetical protein
LVYQRKLGALVNDAPVLGVKHSAGSFVAEGSAQDADGVFAGGLDFEVQISAISKHG